MEEYRYPSRWFSISLLNIEQNMNRVRNYEKLHLLKDALKSLLKLEKENVA